MAPPYSPDDRDSSSPKRDKRDGKQARSERLRPAVVSDTSGKRQQLAWSLMPEHRVVILAQEIGRRIRWLRYAEYGDAKRAQFLEDMNVHKSVLDRIERGEQFPTIPFIMSLRDKYGISFEWLLEGDDRRMPYELMQRINKLSSSADEPHD